MIAQRFTATLALAILAGASAFGQQTYAQRTQDVRCGVLTLDGTRFANLGTNPSANDTPFVFLNVDNNARVKPAGWRFYNPNAPGVATPDIVARWGALSALVGGTGPNVGDTVNKKHAAYWEVRLSQASDDTLSQYDVLMFSGYRNVSLNPAEREKLRKFVDAGGVLWLDLYQDATTQTSIDPINNFPIPFRQVIGGSQPLSYADIFSPLLSTPNTLSLANLEAMATDGDRVNLGAVLFNTPGLSGLDRLNMNVPEDGQRLQPVAGSAQGPVVSVGRIGDGFVVVTSRGYAYALNRVRLNTNTFDTNNRYRAVVGTSDRVQDNICKLVVNMVTLASSYAQSQQGSRKANSSPVGIGAPLLKRFDTPSLKQFRNQAAVFKGLLVVTTNEQVIVYDANPNSDLDGDGNPDDGLQDSSLGTGYDEIWESQAYPGPISPPMCFEVSNGNGVPQDCIGIVDANGVLSVFNAFPSNAQGRLVGATNLTAPSYGGYELKAPDPKPTISGPPVAPTFQEGVITVFDTIQVVPGVSSGRVWLVDARDGVRLDSGGSDFTLGSGVLPEFTGSPLMAYIPIADNSGGVDRVIYGAGKAGNNGAYQTATVVSMWLGARGETPPPTGVTVAPTTLTVQTRAYRQGLAIFLPNTSNNATIPGGSGLGVKLTVIAANGDPWDGATMAAYFQNTVVQGQPGELIFSLNTPLPTNPDGTLAVGLRLDYTLDWGSVSPALATQLIRGTLSFPDDFTRSLSNRRQILGNLAISPKGTLYAVVSTGNMTFSSSASDSGGSFYAIREEGRGAFRMLTRYDLYPPHTMALQGTSSMSVPATVDDNDDLTNIPGPSAFLNGQFRQITFTGGPAVRNGVVYVTAQGRKNFAFIPYGIVMAFRGEPDSPTIRVGDFPGGSTIIQPDIVQSAGGQKTAPNRYSVLQGGQYTYSDATGTLTINNLANVSRGQVQSALSQSQPIIVRSPNGAPDRAFWPDAVASNWSPLLWYVVDHGTAISSSPYVAGDNVYYAGTSALPFFLTQGFIIPPLTNGVGAAVAADIAPNDPFIKPNTGRSWISQIMRLKVLSAGSNPDIKANPDLRWPQFAGIDTFDSFVQRLLQTVIGRTPSSPASDGIGVVGGDRALVLIGAGPLGTVYSGFSRSDIVVADQGRVTRFDPSGNPIWSSDTSDSSGETDSGPAANVKGLLRPTRAYLFGDSDVLAVDPGTNRIVRFDRTGRETRSIKSFLVDPNYTPEGYRSNETRNLTGPTDVLTYGTYVPSPDTPVNPYSNPQPLEYWYHYVVADTANKRIVDMVDRYAVDPTTRRILDPVQDANGQRQLGVLWWHSPSQYSGKQFDYSSLARVVANPASATPTYYLAAAIGAVTPTRVDTGLDQPGGVKPREASDGNGGIVLFQPSNPSATVVINEVIVPAIPANAFYDDVSASWLSSARPQSVKKLGGLTSVTARTVNGNVVAIMFTDSTGVYEIVPAGSAWAVRWMLPNESYRVMRGVYNLYNTSRAAPFNVPGNPSSRNSAELRAMYARRLDSGEVLVVNGYTGSTRGFRQPNGQFLDRVSFGGEVLQIDGTIDPGPVAPGNPNALPGFNVNKTNLGFGYLSIKFELPPVTGTRSLLQPIFADRR